MGAPDRGGVVAVRRPPPEMLILHGRDADIPVTVVRKDLKHLHILVQPPDARVLVKAPLHVDEVTLRNAVHTRLNWIEQQRRDILARQWPTPPQYVEGDACSFRGEELTLQVVERPGRPSVSLVDGTIVLRVPPGSDAARRERVLSAWYRREMEAAVPPLLARWEPRLGVRVAEWRIKRMRTRWGTCNHRARRIWLNLELIKHSPRHLEYVLVHELVHLHEPGHNARFQALMDSAMPDWRERRQQLNLTVALQLARTP